jgi:hypothetical protein
MRLRDRVRVERESRSCSSLGFWSFLRRSFVISNEAPGKSLKPTPLSPRTQRLLLGVLAAALLGGGVWLWYWGPGRASDVAIAAGMMRVGIVLAALCAALPSIRLISTVVPAWLVMVTLLCLLAVAWRPRMILFFGPVLLVLWVIGPRWLSRGK